MIRLAVAVTLLVGCRVSLEESDTAGLGSGPQCVVNTMSRLCMDATSHSDLPWIENNIFATSCAFSGCHSSANDAGKLDLRPGMSHDHLVGASSIIEPTRKLVVPGDVEASYLMLMLGDISSAMASPPGGAPPNDIGYMPQNAPILCCQKLEAVERWIMAGAPSM